MSELLTTDIWKQITATAKKCKTKSYVAVAYFGKGGASMLPLRSGSKLVVDASEMAVKSGQTNPSELLILYKKGIKVYSYPFLHAKVFVIGTRLYIGSTNVSARSANTLKEAAMTTTSRDLVQKAKAYIESSCVDGELGPEQLKKLAKIYRPPFVPGGNNTGGRSSQKSAPKFHVANLVTAEYSQGYEVPLKEGIREAKGKRVNRSRHLLTEFEYWGFLPYKEEDRILMITEENGRQLVSPPGRVIHIKRWRGGKSHFIFLEVPDKRRKGIESVSRSLDKTLLSRDGARNKAFAATALSLWP